MTDDTHDDRPRAVWYDELTGVYFEHGHEFVRKLWLIVAENGTPIACGRTEAAAKERQLALGVRAHTHIIEW